MTKEEKNKFVFRDIFTAFNTLLAIVALVISIKSCIRSDELFNIQNTPRLTTQITGQSYIGPMKGRIDEIVSIPITVFNNSDTFAYGVTLDLLISDGINKPVSLNDYFKSINAPILYKERLTPREQWALPPLAPSVIGNAKELYSTGKYKLKAKLQLTWKDAKGKEHKFINLEELRYIFIKDEKDTEAFVFESRKVLNNRDAKKELEENWGMNFNY